MWRNNVKLKKSLCMLWYLFLILAGIPDELSGDLRSTYLPSFWIVRANFNSRHRSLWNWEYEVYGELVYVLIELKCASKFNSPYWVDILLVNAVVYTELTCYLNSSCVIAYTNRSSHLSYSTLNCFDGVISRQKTLSQRGTSKKEKSWR